MNFVANICSRIPQDALNPTHFCKAWDGDGSPTTSCPIEGEVNPELCEFAVKPVQRVIPWLHGEVKEEVKPVSTKTKKKAK